MAGKEKSSCLISRPTPLQGNGEQFYSYQRCCQGHGIAGSPTEHLEDPPKHEMNESVSMMKPKVELSVLVTVATFTLFKLRGSLPALCWAPLGSPYSPEPGSTSGKWQNCPPHSPSGIWSWELIAVLAPIPQRQQKIKFPQSLRTTDLEDSFQWSAPGICLMLSSL